MRQLPYSRRLTPRDLLVLKFRLAPWAPNELPTEARFRMMNLDDKLWNRAKNR